jgi:hypothetical protein
MSTDGVLITKAFARELQQHLRGVGQRPSRNQSPRSHETRSRRYWVKLIEDLGAPTDGFDAPTKAKARLWVRDPDTDPDDHRLVEVEGEVGEIEVINRYEGWEGREGQKMRVELLDGEWTPYDPEC